MPLLQVRGLEKWYGRRQVVNGVDYEVERGEVVGLARPERCRQDHQLPDDDRPDRLPTAARSSFDGRDVTRLPMYLRARAGMGYLAQDTSVFRQLSVEDNLMAILETRKDMTRKQRVDRQNELLDQFGLTKIRKTKANRVSGGERRRLEIARSLITEPKMIMLDEPFAGIDPKTVAEIQDQIRDLVERYNIGILLTDHQFRETLEVTDRCYLIREGRRLRLRQPRADPEQPRRSPPLHRRTFRRRPPARPPPARISAASRFRAALAEPDPVPSAAPKELLNSSYIAPIHTTAPDDLTESAFTSAALTISTDAYIGQLEEYTIEYRESPPEDDPDGGHGG